MRNYREFINQPIYLLPINFDNCANIIQWGKNNLFKIHWWDNLLSICKKIKLGHTRKYIQKSKTEI